MFIFHISYQHRRTHHLRRKETSLRQEYKYEFLFLFNGETLRVYSISPCPVRESGGPSRPSGCDWRAESEGGPDTHSRAPVVPSVTEAGRFSLCGPRAAAPKQLFWESQRGSTCRGELRGRKNLTAYIFTGITGIKKIKCCAAPLRRIHFRGITPMYQ